MTAEHQTLITGPTFTGDSKKSLFCVSKDDWILDDLLKRQFLYVHELHDRRVEIQSRCQMTCRFRDDLIRAGRLGLINHTKAHMQTLPTSALHTNA